MLHIERVNCSVHSHYWYQLCPEKTWITYICQSLHTEDEIFKMSLSTTYDAQIHPHRNCSQNHKVPGQLLRVCRQITTEAHPILWATNTLSFRRRDDLSAWMKKRLSAQKALIKSIHVDFSWRQQLYDQEVGNFGVVKSLVNLQQLHLYAEDDYNPNGRSAALSIDNLQEWWHRNQATLHADSTLNYKQLPLKNVTVVLTAGKHGPMNPVVLPKDDWRQRERVIFAQTVRHRLLASEGAQQVAQEWAETKAFQQAALEQRRASEPPCQDASTREECVKVRQENRELRAFNFYLHNFVYKTKVRACSAEHVCQACLEDGMRTRAEARTCLRPGRCENKKIVVWCVGLVGYVDGAEPERVPSQTAWITTNPTQTIRAVVELYLADMRSMKDVAWVRFKGNLVDLESTVEEVGLEDGNHLQILLQ